MRTVTPNLITGPTTEAVSVNELKLQVGIDPSDTSWDLYLPIPLVAARKYYEWRTGRTMHQTTWEIVLDTFQGGEILLPRATPLIGITSIKYKDSDGVETTMDASDYIADTDSIPGLVMPAYNESWPSFTPYPASPIKIRYTAGIATSSPIGEIPAEDKAPILMIASALFENRQAWSGVDFRTASQFLDIGLSMLLDFRTVEWVT